MKRLSLLIVAVLSATMLASCSDSSSEGEIAVPILETEQTEFNTVKAEISDISEKYYQTGSYAYPYSEVITFSASGQVETVEIESGDEVKAGDLLCTLNTDDVQEQIEEKEIYLNQAKQTLSTLQSNGGSSGEIEMAELELEIQQLEYDHLVDSLEDYKVYAPCDGTVTITAGQYFSDEGKYNQGNLAKFMQVSEGETFGYAVDRSEEYLCCEVYDNPLNNVNFGTKVVLTQGVNESSGTVTDVMYNQNGDYSTYVYVITPDNKDELFDFGDIDVCFDVYSRLDTVVVPQKAVKTVGDRKFVNMLVDGVKIEQDVETGIEDGDSIEITSGLSGGEELIIN